MSDNFLLDDSFDFLLSQNEFEKLLNSNNDVNSTNNLSLDISDINFDLGFDLDFKVDTDQNLQELSKNVVKNENEKNVKRFPDINHDELDDIANMCSEKSTRYQTKWGVKLFRGKLSYN